MRNAGPQLRSSERCSYSPERYCIRSYRPGNRCCLGHAQKETQQNSPGMRAQFLNDGADAADESSEENLGEKSPKSQDMTGRRQKTGHSPGSAVIAPARPERGKGGKGSRHENLEIQQQGI